MLASLSQSQIILYLVLVAFFCGGIIFYLAGLVIVKTGTAVIIERIGLYHKTLYKGIHYLMPLGYRRVASYTLNNLKTINICGKIIVVEIVITDVEKYHYSLEKMDNVLEDLKSFKYNSISEYIIDLSQKLTKVSCTLKEKGDNL